MSRRGTRRRRDDGGSVAVITAALAMALVLTAALTVDIGMQRVVRSDVQALADVVALDAARLLDGRDAEAVVEGDVDHASLAATVATSVARNDSGLGQVEAVDAVPVYLDVDVNGANVARRLPSGAIVEVPDAEVPDAVLVTATASVDFSFVSGSGGATRTAIGAAARAACFQLGSFAASIAPGNAPLFSTILGPLVGSSTVRAAGYQGLATATLTLADLLAAPSISIGSVAGLVSAPRVTVGAFYLAAASVLQQQGRLLEAQALRLAAVSAVSAISIDLLQLFDITTATDSVLQTRLNVLDLLVGAAFLADGDNLVGLPNLQAGNAKVGVTNTSLSVISRPRITCNDQEAKTSQVSLVSDAKLSLAIPIVKTGVVDLSLVDPTTGKPDGTIGLKLDAFLAGARARLSAVECAPDRFTAQVWNDLVRLRLSGGAHLKGEVTVNLTVLGIPLVGVKVPVTLDITVAADASKPAGSTPQEVVFAVPPRAYGEAATVDGAAVPVLPNVTVSLVPGSIVAGPVTVRVLGANVVLNSQDLLASVTPLLAGAVTSIGDVVSPLVNPLVSEINTIITPLARGLGLQIPGADFYGLPTPQCNSPRLRG